MELRKITTPRLTTACRFHGRPDGRKLLLIHGNASSSVFYEHIMERLEDKFCMAAPDLRCFCLLYTSGRRASKIARMGVNMSPEGRLIFNELSVEENLRAGAYCIRSRAEAENNMKRVLQLFPRLEERLRQHAGTLSGGEQQMLAIGRALMASPKLLLLDEPSLGLAPLIIKDIFRTLQEIRAEGTTILIVEQNALATLKIADMAYVLELGLISMNGPANVLLSLIHI